MPLTEKRCSACGESKTREAFAADARMTTKHRAICRACRATKNHVYYLGRQEKYASDYRRTAQLRWSRNLFARYGMRDEEYDAILAAQGGVCAVCAGINASGKRLSVDHDHETDAIRELLCDACNTTLGLMKESSALLRSLAEYLEKHAPAALEKNA